jgi:hypothetical protein
MTSASDSILSLLRPTQLRLMEILALSARPVSGREFARILEISPTSAIAALKRLEKAGIVYWEPSGKAHLWRLAESDPTVQAWLAETGARSRPEGAPSLVHFPKAIRPFALCGSFDAGQRHTTEVDDVTCLPCLRAKARQGEAECVTEHGILMPGGGHQVRYAGPEIERFYPLAKWIENMAADGQPVERRRVRVVTPWALLLTERNAR